MNIPSPDQKFCAHRHGEGNRRSSVSLTNALIRKCLWSDVFNKADYIAIVVTPWTCIRKLPDLCQFTIYPAWDFSLSTSVFLCKCGCIGCSERRLIGHSFYHRNFLRVAEKNAATYWEAPLTSDKPVQWTPCRIDLFPCSLYANDRKW
jgi:hypothetical protein